VIDTPGILDHPLEDRNTIEMQSITALAHLRCCILYFLDLSEQCGYSLNAQVSLFHSIRPLFAGKPVVIVANKADIVKLADLDDAKRELVMGMLDKGAGVIGIEEAMSAMAEGAGGKTSGSGMLLVEMSCVTEEGVSNVKNMVSFPVPFMPPKEIPPSSPGFSFLFFFSPRFLFPSRIRRPAISFSPTGSSPSSAQRRWMTFLTVFTSLCPSRVTMSPGPRTSRPRRCPASSTTRRTRCGGFWRWIWRSRTEVLVFTMSISRVSGFFSLFFLCIAGRKGEAEADGIFAGIAEKYLLPEDWRYDVIPEIMDGKNVMDFIDPEIEARLLALEAEEEARDANPDVASDDDEDEEGDDDGMDVDGEEEAGGKKKARDVLALAKRIREKKKMLIEQHRREKGKNRSTVPRKHLAKVRFFFSLFAFFFSYPFVYRNRNS
jgi:hypothetical protein